MNPEHEQAVIEEESETPEPTDQPIAEKYDLAEIVCGQVLTRLGKPPHFAHCTACHITGTRNYRVNVWTAKTVLHFMTTNQIVDSFFVTVDDEGKVTKPEIKRKYTNET